LLSDKWFCIASARVIVGRQCVRSPRRSVRYSRLFKVSDTQKTVGN
jgi:hypothetical protein